MITNGIQKITSIISTSSVCNFVCVVLILVARICPCFLVFFSILLRISFICYCKPKKKLWIVKCFLHKRATKVHLNLQRIMGIFFGLKDCKTSLLVLVTRNHSFSLYNCKYSTKSDLTVI